MDPDTTGDLAEGLTTFAFLVLFLSAMGTMIYRMWIRHLLHHNQAQTSFPGLAAELHLRHNRPRDPKGIGSLSGIHRGYRVSIDADAHESSAKIQVRLKRRHALDLTRQRWGDRDGKQPVAFPQRKLNRYFKTRLAPPELASWLSAGCPRQQSPEQGGPVYRQAGAGSDSTPDVAAALDRFIARWGRKLVVCELVRDELGCSPALGSGENTVQSLTADQVRSLLPDMIDLAEALDGMPAPFAEERADD